MFLTVSTSYRPATDLGFLLHKNPARVHTFEVFGGVAHVFYPEATTERCTAALLLEVDPIDLVRRRGHGSRAPAAGGVDQYVNDRPYAATSLLSVALGKAFASARSGRSADRPELAAQAIPLEATIAALPSEGGADLVRRLFEPLGYTVHVSSEPLDRSFPEWGMSRYHRATLRATVRLADLLTHLTVLIPALDGEKHYWVGDAEVDKLLQRAGEWLGTHPERDLIVRRYLRDQRGLTREALRRLTEEDDIDPEARVNRGDALEEGLERPLNLKQQRLQAVVETIRQAGASTVADLGCGEGRLIELLLADPRFTRILGVDVSVRALERAARKLHLDSLAPHQRERLSLVHGSLTYRDERLRGWDAAAAVEVIEHLDLDRVDAFSASVLGHARPSTLVVTTPNAEYNQLFPNLGPGRTRHPDHRFEWTRSEFHAWAESAADRFGYSVSFRPIGDADDRHGPPTQMAVFQR
jgi:3' terminal RNA ribose 2'-O-methyltransferase Hen1